MYTINGNKRVVLEYANNGDTRCGFNLTGTPLKAQKDQFVPVFSMINHSSKNNVFIELRENFAIDDFDRTLTIPKFQDLLRCVSHFGAQN